jgi:Fe-S-cluster containining protein
MVGAMATDDSSPLETDLRRIAAAARANWADNWNFRAFLRKSIDPAVLDGTVQRLNAAVSAGIDCRTCANCCREIFPILDDADVDRLASHHGVTRAAFDAEHLRPIGAARAFNAQPCPMLQADGCCGVYAARPDDCRSYPHLHKDDFLSRSVGVIENYRICPIIYNVYERLKRAFPGYDRGNDYTDEDDALQ